MKFQLINNNFPKLKHVDWLIDYDFLCSLEKDNYGNFFICWNDEQYDEDLLCHEFYWTTKLNLKATIDFINMKIDYYTLFNRSEHYIEINKYYSPTYFEVINISEDYKPLGGFDVADDWVEIFKKNLIVDIRRMKLDNII